MAPPPAGTSPTPATEAPGETTPPGRHDSSRGHDSSRARQRPPARPRPPAKRRPLERAARLHRARTPASGPFTAGDNDTSGVTDDEIVIGIHAPVTGASPIPQESFDVGKDIYWQLLADSAPDQLFGRKREGRLP